jgi:hypothetical protein
MTFESFAPSTTMQTATRTRSQSAWRLTCGRAPASSGLYFGPSVSDPNSSVAEPRHGPTRAGGSILGELLRAAENAAIAHLSLIYNRAVDPAPGSATTIAQLLACAPPSPIVRPASVWPVVPRSPALRLRYDCRSTLGPDEFLRVDELLHTTITLTDRWLARHPRPSHVDLQAACAVLAFAMSPDQAHIRASAVEIALTTAGIRKPAPTRPDLPGRPPSTSEMTQLLGFTDPQESGKKLASIITGLPEDLVEIIGADQVTSSSILGEPVPHGLQPITRAVQRRSGALFAKPTLSLPNQFIAPGRQVSTPMS